MGSTDMTDKRGIYACVCIFTFLLVIMIVCGSTYSWDDWYVYSPAYFGFVLLLIVAIYNLYWAAFPSSRRSPPPQQRRQIQIITVETDNPGFQLEPVMEPTSQPTLQKLLRKTQS